MKYEYTPSVYAARLRKDEEEYRIQKQKNLTNSKFNANKEFEEKEKELQKVFGRKDFILYFLYMYSLFVLLTTIAGIVGELAMGFLFRIHGTGIGLILQIIGGIVAGGAVGFLCGLLGVLFPICVLPIAYPIFCAVQNNKIAKTKLQISRLEKEKENFIKNESLKVLEEIQRHNFETERKIAQYEEDFEREVEEQCLEFTNAMSTSGIVKWLCTEFFKRIKYSDRDSYAEDINVSFDFYVKKDQICLREKHFHDVYSFEEHYLEQLQDILQQTALAKAVSSQVEHNILRRYDQDKTRNAYKIDVEYEYSRSQEKSSICDTYDCVLVKMTYIESNDN